MDTVNFSEAPTGVFQSKDEAEYVALVDRGKVVELEGSIQVEVIEKNGDKTKGRLRKVRVPRHNISKTVECGEAVAGIIDALFPDDFIFLLSVKTDESGTAISKIHDIIFNKVYQQAAIVILCTFNIRTEEQGAAFFEDLSNVDFLNLFCTIIEQDFNNEVVDAVIKKFQGLLAERFHLENVLPDLQGFSAEALQKSLKNIHGNSSSS